MRRSFLPLDPLGLADISPSDPPLDTPGDVIVWLDADGRLLELASRSSRSGNPPAPGPPDWTAMFREAGLDPARWTPVPADYVPPAYADRRMAWTGVLAWRPQDEVRLEAAAHQGRIVSLTRVGIWTTSDANRTV